jgi:aspartate aminotransferase-like enzyme
LLWALEVQLDRILAEGLEARWARHERLYQATARWALERGMSFASAEGARSWTVSCLKPPAGVEAQAIVKGLAARGITIGGGYGDLKPTTFRIGHMGEVREDDLAALLSEIDQILAVSLPQVAV